MAKKVFNGEKNSVPKIFYLFAFQQGKPSDSIFDGVNASNLKLPTTLTVYASKRSSNSRLGKF